MRLSTASSIPPPVPPKDVKRGQRKISPPSKIPTPPPTLYGTRTSSKPPVDAPPASPAKRFASRFTPSRSRPKSSHPGGYPLAQLSTETTPPVPRLTAVRDRDVIRSLSNTTSIRPSIESKDTIKEGGKHKFKKGLRGIFHKRDDKRNVFEYNPVISAPIMDAPVTPRDVPLPSTPLPPTPSTPALITDILARINTMPTDSEERERTLLIAQAIVHCVECSKESKIASEKAEKAARDAELFASSAQVILGRLAKLVEPGFDSEALEKLKEVVRRKELVVLG